MRATLFALPLVAACGGSAGPAPTTADLRGQGTLAPCPESPNCVSSQGDPADAEHYTDALPLHGDPSTVIARLAEVIGAEERTALVDQSETYLHATYTSKIFRFVDDVELLVDREAGVVHVRSASRVGYDDMDANPNRIAALRQAWDAAQ